MRKILFAGGEFSVAPLCLGTVHYGTALPDDAAKRQLDQYTEAGGNFLDTAHVYGDWAPGPRGRSERVIGAWLRETGSRDRIVISTKGGHPRPDQMDRPRLRPEDLEADLRESLDRLGVSQIDLYFLHRDDPSIPAAEMIDWLSQKAQEGLIRRFGCSNWHPSRILEAYNYAKRRAKEGFACNQLMWSLAIANRAHFHDPTLMPMDAETYACHAETGMAAMAYTSVAKGYFMRRQAGTQPPASLQKLYEGAANDAIFAELIRLSAESGLSLFDLCMLYFSGHPFPAVPIASFSTPEQLGDGLRFMAAEPSDEILARLHAIRKAASS